MLDQRRASAGQEKENQRVLRSAVASKSRIARPGCEAVLVRERDARRRSRGNHSASPEASGWRNDDSFGAEIWGE